MSDRLHDHINLGFRPGCVACAQVEADMVLTSRTYKGAQILEVLVPVEGRWTPAHPEIGPDCLRSVSASVA